MPPLPSSTSSAASCPASPSPATLSPATLSPASLRGMVLAAGLGTRMRPVTDHTPKPLVSIAGRTMLDRALDHLEAAGISPVAVNLHHLADQVRHHLHQRQQAGRGPDICLSDESNMLLETGGGLRKALPLLQQQAPERASLPLVATNSDILWLDGPTPAIERLCAAWDGRHMDALLLLHPRQSAWGYQGRGDFVISPAADGSAVPVSGRRPPEENCDWIYSGVLLLSPATLDQTPDGPWSLNLVFDRLLQQQRLYALPHDGAWFHVGTADAIAPASALVGSLEKQGRI